MSKLEAFSFISKKVDEQHATDTLQFIVHENISDKKSLLTVFSSHLSFPSYFGFNWDAFAECLQDLHWIKENKIIISHKCLPKLPKSEMKIYLEILADTINSWKKDGQHKFIAIFPKSERENISEYLA